ncbi:allantoate amidohydrolase [Stappia sp. GBMRC 2046]|uniref:Allantoate amidohydrolase n=1 Tax=Stappia sediminis TaxID=2692190 RepID=A0A7X3LT48_9HYPH|nr:allantoate amidohydrolase [Stappia sediminis]
MPLQSTYELGETASRLIDDLSRISADEDKLTRLYLTPEHRKAADLVGEWMRQAGLEVTEDSLGTVRGRLSSPSTANSKKRLLIGSHIDTVIDGGKFDGSLGVICAILAAREIRKRGMELPFDIDVLAFGDEEGVRFPTTLLSSSALAGTVPPGELDACDSDGISVAAALREFGGDPENIGGIKEDPDKVIGYLEVHIEQGPVLENEELPIGIVTSLAGAERHWITVQGEAGHAGTVPMDIRRDALSVAADLIGAIEVAAKSAKRDSVVATIGSLEVSPGAVNVIPAEVKMTLDLRAAREEPRAAAIEAIKAEAARISEKRGCRIEFDQFHEVKTSPCAQVFQDAAERAIASMNIRPHRLMSGAGHDGQAMKALTEIGMLFVRCRNGISHNPAEHVSVEDMGVAVEAMVRWVAEIAQEGAGA